jgi:hypothetical protein
MFLLWSQEFVLFWEIIEVSQIFSVKLIVVQLLYTYVPEQ